MECRIKQDCSTHSNSYVTGYVYLDGNKLNYYSLGYK